MTSTPPAPSPSPPGASPRRQRRRSIFGARDWDDVRGVVTARLRKKFPRTWGDDIEDAVSLAMVDLVDYWVQLPSSVDTAEPDKTFWQACKRGTWMATTFLTQEWDLRDMPIGDLSDDYARPGLSAPVWSPEERIIAHQENQSLQRFIRRQAATPAVGAWLAPFLAGVSVRQQADIEGVSHPAIVQRWQGRMATFVADVRQALVTLAR